MKADAVEPAGTGWKFDLLCWGGLFVLLALLYGHTLDVPWYFDDNRNILMDLRLRDLDRIPDLLFRARGLSRVSFMLNYAVHQLEPAGYHIFNILIHGLASGLAYLVAKRIFPASRVLPVCVAVLFLVHPLQTQSVTYVVQRMTSLCGLMFLLACYCYIRFREKWVASGRLVGPAQFSLFFGALLCGGLAVLSKENAAVLPGALFLLDRYFLPAPVGSRWDWKRQAALLMPFVLPAVLMFVLRFKAPATAEALTSVTGVYKGQHVTPVQYLFTEFPVIWLYIRLAFIPFPQMLIYKVPIVSHLFNANSIVALVGLLGLGGGAFYWRKRLPFLSFGILWFLLCLSVESTLIPLDTVFEHRLYLPLFGFLVALVGVLGRYLKPRHALVAMVILAMVWGGRTWYRNNEWRDDLAFYADNLRRVGSHSGLTVGYAKRLNDQGRFAEAEVALRELVKDSPDYQSAYVNLAYSLNRQGKYAETIRLISQASERKIFSAKLLTNLGEANQGLGRNEFAVNAYLEALEIDPKFLPALRGLGLAYVKIEKYAEAEDAFRKLVRLYPDSGESYLNLALLAARGHRYEEALGFAMEGVKALPENVRAWYLVGSLAKQAGEPQVFDQALARLRTLSPDSAAQLLEPNR